MPDCACTVARLINQPIDCLPHHPSAHSQYASPTNCLSIPPNPSNLFTHHPPPPFSPHLLQSPLLQTAVVAAAEDSDAPLVVAAEDSVAVGAVAVGAAS